MTTPGQEAERDLKLLVMDVAERVIQTFVVVGVVGATFLPPSLKDLEAALWSGVLTFLIGMVGSQIGNPNTGSFLKGVDVTHK